MTKNSQKFKLRQRDYVVYNDNIYRLDNNPADDGSVTIVEPHTDGKKYDVNVKDLMPNFVLHNGVYGESESGPFLCMFGNFIYIDGSFIPYSKGWSTVNKIVGRCKKFSDIANPDNPVIWERA